MLDKDKEEIPSEETPSFEVVALCALLARIMMRCLREKNPRIMELVSFPSQSEEHEREGTHDAA